jgi:hypothetical protein
MKKEKFRKLLTKIESPEGYNKEDYISYSLLRKAKGGFSIQLIYEYKKNKKTSSAINLQDIKQVYIVLDLLEAFCKNKKENSNEFDWLTNDDEDDDDLNI